MANFRLTFASGPFDRPQSLRDGSVRPEDLNRPTTEALLQYLHEQGRASRRVAAEELFAASTLRDIPLSEGQLVGCCDRPQQIAQGRRSGIRIRSAICAGDSGAFMNLNDTASAMAWGMAEMRYGVLPSRGGDPTRARGASGSRRPDTPATACKPPA